MLALNIVYAYTPPAGSPLAKKEHPRLWLTSADLPMLRASVSLGGPLHSQFQKWVNFLDAQYSTAGNTESYRDWNAMNYAYLYLLGPVPGISYAHTQTEYGAKAKQLLLAVPSSSLRYTDSYSYAGAAYDWLFPLLTASEKTAVVNYLKRPLTNDWYLHSNQIWNSAAVIPLTNVISASLAYYGDGIDDASAQSGLDSWNTKIMGPKGVLSSESWYAGDDGGMGQGRQYGAAYTLPAYLNMLELWRTANGLSFNDVYANENVVKTFPQWETYSSLPYASLGSGPGGRNWVTWKTHQMTAAVNAWYYRCYFPRFAYLYATVDPDLASLSKWLMLNRVGNVGFDSYDGTACALTSIFLTPNNVVPKSPSEIGMPLNREFSHMGWVTMRTGWDSLDDTLVTFNAPEFSVNLGYQKIGGGSFTIDRKGPLVIHAGNGAHDSYQESSWSHNIMLFVPPNPPSGTSPEYLDMGGQRRLFEGCSDGVGMMTENGPCDMREGDLKTQFRDNSAGRDYSYIGANLIRYYNSPVSSNRLDSLKVKSYTRQFVYFYPNTPGADPDRIVIFDRAESLDETYEKRWLLHTSNNPVVNGNAAPNTPVRGGSGAGKTTYTGADLITDSNTVDGANGKIFAKVLLPESRKIVEVNRRENPYGADTPWWTPPSASQLPYSGTSRVEVIPSTPSLKDNFLHVIEATDSGVSSMTPSALLQGTNMQGARFGNRIVMFNQNEAVLTSGNFVIDSAGTYKVLIADLAPGATYTVSHNPTTTQTASSAGTVYVDITTTSSNTSVTVTQSGAAPPSSFDFALSNGGSKIVNQGSSTTNTITLALTSGTTQPVSFSVSGLPTSASASFSPASCSPTCTTTMTINTASSTPAGTYTITVTGTAGVTRTTIFTLTVTSVADITPPARSNGLPSGTLPVNTASATLSLLTSEASTCRYSTEPNIAYSSMTNILSTTGGTSHSASVAGLSVGNTYNYYVRCIDAAGNANTDDYGIAFSVHSSGGTTWYVAAGSSGTGTSSNPFGKIQEGLNAAMPGDTIIVRPGAYNEVITTVRSGTAVSPISLRSEGGLGTVTVMATGRVFSISHAYHIIEGIVFDGQYGTNDLIQIGGGANNLVFKNSEIKRSGRDCIDMAGPQNVLFDNLQIHNCIWFTGSQFDAHGIAGGPVKDFTIKNSEIYYFTGDGIQIDPGRNSPGWNNVLIENMKIWNGPLPTAENTLPAGAIPGENAIDTKAGGAFPRARIIIKNITAYGFKGGAITNQAAFNIKENVNATIDGATVYNSEIGFRIRAPADVTIQNTVVYGTTYGIRYEDGIANPKVYSTTFGSNVPNPFFAASSSGTTFTTRNFLILSGSLPSQASHSSNRAVASSAFVNAAANDYHLIVGSPAIDAGTPVAGITTDRDGVTRPQGSGWDIGAYEFGSVVPPTPLPTDTTPPTVSITSPRGGNVSGLITLSATAIDTIPFVADAPVAGVQFRVDGINLEAEDTTAPYSVSWDTTTAANGVHTISAVARDSAGNTATALINATVNNVVTQVYNPGDLNYDGIVNILDMTIVVINWGKVYFQ